MTVVCAKSATGTYIPPMFIFPRKRMAEGLMANAPVGSIGVCTDNGWTDGNMFMKWLQHFTAIAKPSTQEKHIIISDGHHSHKTLAVVEYANGIEMLTLPPHCTHNMQPLDCTFFKALKSAYNSASDTWMVAHKGQRISFFDMAGIFATAYNKTATVEKAVNGFRVCGLWPYNNQIFIDVDFVASELTNEAQPTSNVTATPSTAATCTTNAATVAANVQSRPTGTATASGATSAATTAATTTITPGAGTISTPAATNKLSTGSATKVPTTHITTTSTSVTTVSSVSALTTATTAETIKTMTINIGLPNVMTTTTKTQPQPLRDAARREQNAKCVLASLVTPVKAAKPRQRKRKAERATHLTSSPFKTILQEKEKSKGKGTKITQKPKMGKKRKKKEKAEIENSGDEEWPCLVCLETASKPREQWIRCNKCHLWAHEACTPGMPWWTCQNCESDDDV